MDQTFDQKYRKKEEVEKGETNRDGSSLKGSKCHLTERKCGMNLLFVFSNGVVCCFGKTKIRECRRHLTVAYSTLCVNGGQSEKMIKITSCYNRK
jgi:hypothetical protein